MKQTNDYVFFFSGREPFSNWYKSDFTIKGIDFNCVEQYMMFSKARLFGDLEIASQILSTDDPKEQKALGRKVKGFDPDVWDARCVPIVTAGLIHKFTQNKELQDILLLTKGKTLVEASPYDKIWGVGLSASDPLITNPENWKGKNLLGIALMDARSAIENNLKKQRRHEEDGPQI